MALIIAPQPEKSCPDTIFMFTTVMAVTKTV
jgi:hypothetical protein